MEPVLRFARPAATSGRRPGQRPNWTFTDFAAPEFDDGVGARYSIPRSCPVTRAFGRPWGDLPRFEIREDLQSRSTPLARHSRVRARIGALVPGARGELGARGGWTAHVATQGLTAPHAAGLDLPFLADFRSALALAVSSPPGRPIGDGVSKPRLRAWWIRSLTVSFEILSPSET